jgi:hypothetical protein
MATITRALLSGSTNGKNIKVAATATLGTTIHTAVSGTSSIDEIWLWAQNSDPSSIKLTIEFGGATSPDNLVEVTIPGESGPVLVIPGWQLQNGLVVTAFAGSANLILINGFENRIA